MPSGRGSPYGTARWRRLRAQVIAAAPPTCGICARPLDKSLSGSHPMGPTVDHIVPTSRGGAMFDAGNLQVVHRKCNDHKNDLVVAPSSSVRSGHPCRVHGHCAVGGHSRDW